jgi:glycosyltransferase involved in cell wall biosynthesis
MPDARFYCRANCLHPRKRANVAAMRILYSHRTLSNDGQAVHIRSLVEALRARGHDVLVSGPGDGSGATEPRAVETGARRSPLRDGARLLPAALRELAEMAYASVGFARLERAARTFRPDIVYERYNLFYGAGAALARRRRLLFLLEVNAPLAEERAAHGGVFFRDLARRSEWALWCSADRVLPVTNVLADIVAAAGVPRDRIAVVPNGADPAFVKAADGGAVRTRYGIEEKFVLGFAGFVREWHGVDRVLRHLSGAPRRDLHLLLVGDGPARAQLDEKAKTWGVAAQLTITGIVPHAAMPAHVAAFDVALLPAATPYSCPLKLFDYMAQARAILAPGSANIREFLAEGEAALFAPDDEADFARRLDALINDAELRARLGAAAKARLLKDNLTWDGAAARVEAVAEEVLRARR